MKFYNKILITIILIISYIYICNITMMPSNIVLMQGDLLNLNTIFGINLKSTQTMEASSSLNNSIVNETGKMDLELSLFNLFPVKDVTVNVIPKTTVIPIGKAIGMKLYTDGVLVVGMTEIEGQKPYENTGIEAGDKIIEIDNTEINNTNDLIACVNASKGKTMEIKYVNDSGEETANMSAVKTGNNEYKLGLWVRDAAAGVGTLTFYEPSTGQFGALGHGINDVDTYELIDIANGELVDANIVEIVKGKNGTPGEIRGSLGDTGALGNISKNTGYGVYGDISDTFNLKIDKSKEVEVANRSEIKTGKAEILCELENGNIGTYEIEIQKIFLENNENNKSMLIKITDEDLIEKTGGIIQGMSGAPIIQNGKLIGAVTHVLVNDSQMGYGVFGDLMIKQMREVD